jgi:beta-lactamase superfamily II metal-dependent hydrolase
VTVAINRRQFLRGTLASIAISQARFLSALQVTASTVHAPVEPWSPGHLDIHHISTGRGNSVLAICPDGTAIMIDAGAVGGSTEALGPARPNDSRRPGEWIGRYALHHLRTVPEQKLDYFVLTHFHGDHMGDLNPASPKSQSGEYRLTGVTDVAELIPIHRLIDRSFPDYNYPAPSTYDATLNYIQFARTMANHGTKVERFHVGSHSQIALTHDAEHYPSMRIQNLAANGEVWTGIEEKTTQLFPELNQLKSNQFPTENACSIALKMSYGPFSYYIGGDLTCDTRFGTQPWMDVESAVARVAGPVNVSALDHHGYYDATCAEFVRQMQSRVYILQAWHASHPALSVLDKLYSPILSPVQPDVFATGLVSAASLADARLSDKMRSQHGHVVIRVEPGGRQYEVLVLDDTNEDGIVLSRFGPYSS